MNPPSSKPRSSTTSPETTSLAPDEGLCLGKANNSDCDALAALARSAHSHPWSASQYRDSLASGHTCWVLRAADDEVGGREIAACCVVSRLFDEVEILDVAVAPQWRRQGVGGRLLEDIFSQLPEDIARILLEVRASNRPARALYRKLGFSEDGRRKNYYPKPDGSREDALLMSLVL
ncbi:ribosomal protein S18-alanine N-acetyltransferase [uncultured Microbulbifer sp.]|uniref:ribosomal protein S18-alanine N-acetyltransferase n=1 Tax=uncultured Microbulbifer sp. TaxID=348147 RepID=UPI00262DFE7D|nr:ribosomal protein S18-alanine N-acetyltransferase [uncultured Microbulbifer sp.]